MDSPDNILQVGDALCVLSDAAVNLGHVVAPLPGVVTVPQEFLEDLGMILGATAKWISWCENQVVSRN